MGIKNALTYGAFGLAADLLAGPFVTRGQGMFLGALTGMFTPDAKDMGEAYDPSRFRFGGEVGGLGMFESLFGHTQGGPRDPEAAETQRPGLGTVGAVALGALALSNLGSVFNLPLYGWAAGLLPYNSGGLVPLAWSNGLIPNWGWGAGLLY